MRPHCKVLPNDHIFKTVPKTMLVLSVSWSTWDCW